jgi:3-hydroxyacyl-CoA dehydrogenase
MSPHIREDTPGFIVNRVARPCYGEAQRMVEAVDLVARGEATAQDVDTAMELGL